MSGATPSVLPEQVPVLYVRGTHYEVGLCIGKTFAALIQSFFKDWDYIHSTVLPVYKTARGKRIYEAMLAISEARYPQYVQELKGISDGAGVPVDLCFLLHNMGILQPETDNQKHVFPDSNQLGCTGVISNVENLILAHNEDAPVEMANRFFIVSAQIVDENGVVIEDFSTLTYPGFLPGYTMGYNKHGFVYCVNTICPAHVNEAGTPINFITRALLAARNKEEVISLLKDTGVGTSDGLSLNFVFANEKEGAVAGNIEIAPNQTGALESEISVHWVEKGSSYVHCNRYLRLKQPEVKSYSSTHRHAAIAKLPEPNCVEGVKRVLSDQSDFTFPVYRVGRREHPEGMKVEGWDTAATVATGLFDIDKKTWAIYTKPPATSDPVVVLPMHF